MKTDNHTRTVIYIVQYLTPVVLLLIFFIGLRNFYDIYGIRKEIIAHLLLLVIGMIIYFPFRIIIQTMIYNEDIRIKAEQTLAAVLVVVFLTAIGFISVWYPLYLIKNEENKQSQSIQMQQADLVASLKDLRMFSLFMQHLVF